ncbi:MAG TPA: cytochrome b/b6 domain-containing protein [Sphingomicrobium sp.]|nr:cytochrome b/b6 domain-containing protein [Sphingomicrobium sp.]
MKSTEGPDAAGQPAIAVWDLPTRLFHWTLAALIGFSWWTAEEEQLELHLYSGYAILTLVLFRLLWGVFGSSTARFANFVGGPSAVRAYLRDVRGWRGTGHTPLGALSVVALLAITLAQVVTGLFNADNDGLYEGPLAQLADEGLLDAAHDLHELLFNVLLVFIALHVLAILFYRFVLGKKLVRAMIGGRAQLEPDTEPMRPGRGWVAIACLLAALAVTRWIIAGAPPFGT